MINFIKVLKLIILKRKELGVNLVPIGCDCCGRHCFTGQGYRGLWIRDWLGVRSRSYAQAPITSSVLVQPHFFLVDKVIYFIDLYLDLWTYNNFFLIKQNT